MYLPKNVWCCIITNEAYVVYYIFLTEDAPICGETRLRLTLKKVNKRCWWFYTFDLKTLHGWKVWRSIFITFTEFIRNYTRLCKISICIVLKYLSNIWFWCLRIFFSRSDFVYCHHVLRESHFLKLSICLFLGSVLSTMSTKTRSRSAYSCTSSKTNVPVSTES
jgi:hypothetical protein